ncbi:MAG: outer membrane lipoprotein carrier protein LolA [Firmicutes bacterium]|nr:outer membrane lipoprotein carrier protein LolA [Bacillota bacterium]
MSKRLAAAVVVALVAMVLAGIVAYQPAAETQTNTSLGSGSDLARALLRAVIERGNEVSFKATQTIILWYPTGSSACITNVIHKAPNLTKTEYLPSATATSGYRVVISDGESTWHYEPSLGVVFHMPGTAPDRARRQKPAGTGPGTVSAASGSVLSLIERNYSVLLVSTESLAGRRAHVIKLKPVHPGNPSRTIWVDTELPFILRTEKYRPNGFLSSASFYNDIEFWPQIDDSTFRLQVPPGVAIVTLPGPGDLVTLEELQDKAGFAVPVPGFVPAGYILEGGTLTRRGDVEVAHLRFTDGLNTISFFVAPPTPRVDRRSGPASIADQFDMVSLGRQVALDGARGQLADYQDAKLLRWQASGYEFTLIGEVDESLLLQMAESVDAPESRIPAKDPLGGSVIKFFYEFFWTGR